MHQFSLKYESVVSADLASEVSYKALRFKMRPTRWEYNMATDLFLRSKSISNECAMSSRIEINKVKDTWGQEKVKLEQDSQGRCYGNLDGRSAILWKEQAQNTGWISICFGGHYTTNDRFIHIPRTLDILDSEDLLSRRAFHKEIVTLDVSTGEGSSSDNSRLSTRA